MTASAQQVADYLSRRLTDWPRDPLPRYMPRAAWPTADRPTAQQLAEELLADAEFAAFGLGTWLGTDQGALAAQAIELVSPPFLRADEQLLREALLIAARMQAAGKRRAALGTLGLGAVAAGVLLAAGTRNGRPS